MAKVPVAFPMAVFPEEEERVVVPVELKVVKAPVDGEDAPIAVELIPVLVVVK